MDHWLCVTPVSVILRHPAPTQWPIIQRNSLRSAGRHRTSAKWWLVGSLSQPGLNHFSNHMLTSDKRWHWCQSVDSEAISVLQPLSDHNSISTSSSREIEYILVKPRRTFHCCVNSCLVSYLPDIRLIECATLAAARVSSVTEMRKWHLSLNIYYVIIKTQKTIIISVLCWW